MLRRLQKMQNAGLIKFIEDHRSRDRILVLDRKGAELVCNVYSLEIENAWIHSGKEQDYYHDLSVAEIASHLVFDANDELEVDLEFEFYLKKEQQRRSGNTKDLGYPDFRVHFKNAAEKIYDVERDCGTISRHAYGKKLLSSHYPLLIITETIQRVKWLFKNAIELQAQRKIFITQKKRLPQNIYSPFKCWSPPNPDLITLKIYEERDN
jgi:hypothetical protein